ncbi:MAG: hypothetical protein U0520_03510 [Candidatus Saccharimonadales bacterium]
MNQLKVVYAEQTKAAEAKGVSNCSYCAIGHDANKATKYGRLTIWMPIMYPLGVKAQQKKKNCEMLLYVLIEQKEIGNDTPENYGRKLSEY